MNKNATIAILIALMTIGAVSATTTTLSDPSITMNYNDTRYVEFCLSGANGQQNIMLVVDPVCKDLDGNYGCQAADGSAAGLFVATPMQASINDGECAMIKLETTIANPADAGQFFYTVNGIVGETTIGSETGAVFVPEFGVAASLIVLAAAGLYIYKKRD